MAAKQLVAVRRREILKLNVKMLATEELIRARDYRDDLQLVCLEDRDQSSFDINIRESFEMLNNEVEDRSNKSLCSRKSTMSMNYDEWTRSFD